MNMKNRIDPNSAALLLCLALLNACGGGGGGGATSSTSIPTAPPSTLQPLASNALGQAPNADGYFPNAAGAYPNAQGIYPNAAGVFPSAAEVGLFANDNGVARNYSTAGAIDKNNPFFKSFGNGRNCASCHQQEEGFSITPKGLEERFTKSDGNDPIFMLNDGANSPLAPVGTLAEKRAAYSMLLTRGVIRIGMKIPDDAEFELVKVIDPYQYASAKELSLFRRPLPSANLIFLKDVMWDGRETALDNTSKDCLAGPLCFATLDANLAHQANSATVGHAQAAKDLTQEEQKAIVAFEKNLFSAQTFNEDAHFLDVAGAQGGPIFLQTTPNFFGINDFLFGNLKTGAKFDENAMQNFSGWLKTTGTSDPKINAARLSIARGEVLFNTRPMSPQIVPLLFDDKLINRATCSTCHNAPQTGNASTPLAISTFSSDSRFRKVDQPMYTLRNKLTGATTDTLDPGVAMKTGKWVDIGRFKVPTLRGLSARAPYFHDGSAATLRDVVNFYDGTFFYAFTSGETEDLIAFLSAL